MKPVPILLLLTLLLAAAPAAAKSDADDVDAMFQEIQKLSNEKKANEAKMQIDLSPRATEREEQRVAGHRRALEAEKKQVEAAYDDMCSKGTCTGEKYGWSSFNIDCHHDSACEASAASYRSKVENFRVGVRAYDIESDALTKRQQAYGALASRNATIETRINDLKRRIGDTRALAIGRERQNCMAGALGSAEVDAVVQDISHCFDQALKSSEVVTVEQQSGRYWPEKRARELAAIAEYLNSGARPGPSTFQPVIVPLRPKSTKKE